MTRRLAVVVVVAAVGAIVVPAVASAPDLQRLSMALGLAGPAAGTALAVAAGRPLLAATALGGAGAYVSGLLSLHGVAVPLAVGCGALAGVAVAALIAAGTARLEGAGFVLATLLLALAGGAAVLAAPGVTGAQSGLGPLPPLSFTLGGHRTEVLTAQGDFHVLVLVAAVGTACAVVLVERGPGPRWRAIGSDRRRATTSGLRPLRGEMAALAIAGGLSALSGALSAHVAQVATPGVFGPDVAAVPLLAVLAAGRRPLGAALLAVATGVVGDVVLPNLGWQGPPDAMDLAIGVLALVTVLTLVPLRRAPAEDREPWIDPDAPWPVGELGLHGCALTVPAITVAAPDGALLVDAPGFTVATGTVHAVVGANGAGKSTLLGTIAARHAGSRPPTRVVLMPQDGGGFPACTVSETLRLAAREGRSPATARRLADLWQARLGLGDAGGRLCAELSSGQRRLLDLGRVLLGTPDVLLCDEPVAGMDPGHRAAAVACMAAAVACGLTVVVAEHDREAVAALADSVTHLERVDAPVPAPGDPPRRAS